MSTEDENISLEDALQLRSSNFLFLSWQTSDPDEYQEKLNEIDILLDKYTKENDKLANHIEKMENKIKKLDDEISLADEQGIFK